MSQQCEICKGWFQSGQLDRLQEFRHSKRRMCWLCMIEFYPNSKEEYQEWFFGRKKKAPPPEGTARPEKVKAG